MASSRERVSLTACLRCCCRASSSVRTRSNRAGGGMFQTITTRWAPTRPGKVDPLKQPADVRNAGLHSLLHVRSHSCPPACAVCTVASPTGNVAQIFTRGARQPAAPSLFHTGISILIFAFVPAFKFCNFVPVSASTVSRGRALVELEALPRLVKGATQGASWRRARLTEGTRCSARRL